MEAQAKLTISVAGSGNVGSFLAIEFFNAGCEIKQIFSRKLETAQTLADKVNAEAINNIASFDANISLLVIALPDRVIPEFIEELSILIGDVPVAFTAASIKLSDINRYFINCGVLYPLQSFTMLSKPDPKTIPFCIEAANSEMTLKLEKVAGLISNDIRYIDSQQRLIIHIAAVFANNFTNHMIAIAESIVNKGNVDFSILWPLINETMSRLKDHNPLQMQTGPAERNDFSTINKHIELLGLLEDDNIKKIYALISENIALMKMKNS